MIEEVDRLQVEEDGPPDPRVPRWNRPWARCTAWRERRRRPSFGGYALLLKQDLGFNGRKRRPPTDPVNALLSFGYTLLMNHVLERGADCRL